MHHCISSMQLGHIRAVYGYGPVLGPVAASILLPSNQGKQSKDPYKLLTACSPHDEALELTEASEALTTFNASHAQLANLGNLVASHGPRMLRSLPTRFQKGADA